ncbi:MAG: bifunctional precorrin-2 dehydrogenase/sirohydrochlorin ferrochelatase [Candidatus Poribacteria bacterium]|nr:bifunctional precorrin-2 dehydrogenase/sirohydrochlorin ferrochelatase [Candidatus Poribacteria bacterium]
MFYPAHFNLQNRKCLVVGGGAVAERKVVSLLLSGGIVTLISPHTTTYLEFLAQVGQIVWHNRQFQSGDTDGMFLACAATDLPEINSSVFEDAYEKNGIRLVNVVDVIPECTFAAASVVVCGGVSISVSTSGLSPAMSRRIREYLESRFGASSLYADESAETRPVPVENRQLPYPAYLLLQDRECGLICTSAQTSQEMKRRVSLLEGCGSSITPLTASQVDSARVSDAFLLFAETGCEAAVFAKDALQPREFLDDPQTGEFVTPELVVDEDLIIGVSTQSENPVEQNAAGNIHAELLAQFENSGYGAFIGFLGSLRPVVLEEIPTQRGRQRFFEALIDDIPGAESSTTAEKPEKCCLGFVNSDCSTECVFNMIRHGRIQRARKYALERIENEKSHDSSVTEAPGMYRHVS